MNPTLHELFALAFEGLTTSNTFDCVYVYHHLNEGISAFNKLADSQFPNFLQQKSNRDLFLIVCEKKLEVGFETMYTVLEPEIKQCIVLCMGPRSHAKTKPIPKGFPKSWIKNRVEKQLRFQLKDAARLAEILSFFKAHSS